MKLNFLLLTTLAVLTSAGAFAQTKYIKTNKGEIMDTVAYAKLKDARIERMKSLFPKNDMEVTITESFEEIKRTKDSLIYTYNWAMRIIEKKVKETESFDADDYIGKEFPLPTLNTLDNKKLSINDLKGKPTLINFWFTTCKPCIDEMPVLSRIKNQLKDSVNFIAITFEPTHKVKAFYKKHKFNFTQIADAKKFTDAMNMEAFPINIFLDKNGIVTKIESGIPYTFSEKKKMKMGDGEDFITILRELL